MGWNRAECNLHLGRMASRGPAGFAVLALAIVTAANGAAANAQAAPAATQSAAPAATAVQAPAAGAPASATDLAGIWQGTLHIAQANRDLRTEIKIAKAADGSFKTTFYSIDQGGQPFVASKTTFQDGTLSFALDAIGGKYDGKMSPDGKTITGTWTQGPNTIALNLERTTEDAAWPIPEPIKPMAADAHPSFDVATIKPSQPGGARKGIWSQWHAFQNIQLRCE